MRCMSLYARYLKKVCDQVVATALIIIFSPILIGLAFGVFISLRTPIFFREIRIGQNGRLFVLLKYRTMNFKSNKYGKFLHDELRTTRFGKILRSTGLDELPQLINVIKGDMSLVGPRPLPAKYRDLLNDEQNFRHLVRPGITGYVQVKGGNLNSWKEKFELDNKYLNDLSFFNDIKVMIQTLRAVGKKSESPHMQNLSYEDYIPDFNS